jgi:hypothetical protein
VLAEGDGRSLRLYLDGTLIKQLLRLTSDYSYDSGFTFRVSSAQYGGGIDEVVLYDRAVTTNEIRALARGLIP